MSWDSQLQGLSEFTSTIYAKDGGAPYTTDTIGMTDKEVAAAIKAIKEGPASQPKICFGGEAYMLIQNNSEEEYAIFKKSGKGGGIIQLSNTLLLVCKAEEGQSQGTCNSKVKTTIDYLKSSGY